ncbi:MAG: collagen type alpha, partial [Streptomyces sp.]|nr:collagen type alpha [Streptomyces sp.]
MLPNWLEWVLNEVLGMDWPTADEDKLFEAANLWRDFATDVQGIQYTGVTAAGNVISENYGDSIDGFKGTWDKFSGNGSGYLDDAQTVALVVAGVLDAAGAIVIAAKAAVIVQLAILAAEIIAAQAAAPFTFGLSEVGVAGATQATRMIVRRLLKELKDALIEAIVEAMKEPAISALEAIITDLISQSLNVNFGAQKGIDVGQTLKAGSDAAVDQLKNTPQTIAEGVRDNLGGKAGHSAHHAIDSRNGHGDSNSSDGDGSSSTSSSTSTDSTNSSDGTSSTSSTTTTTSSDGNSGPTTTSPTSPLSNGNSNGNGSNHTPTSSDSTPPTLQSTSAPDATPGTTPDSTPVPAPAASPVTHAADNYPPS